MKKLLFISFLPLLLFGCSITKGSFNKTLYQDTYKIIYEEMFVGKVEITDREVITQITDIFGLAKKEPEKFVPKEQFLFIRSSDTLTVTRNGASLQDARGTYVLSSYMKDELDKLLQKVK